MKTYNNFSSIYVNSQSQELSIVCHESTGWCNDYDYSGKDFHNYPFYIGGRVKHDYYSKLTIKELRIYTKALTDEEVSSNYQGNPVTDSLLVHYDFTE